MGGGFRDTHKPGALQNLTSEPVIVFCFNTNTTAHNSFNVSLFNYMQFGELFLESRVKARGDVLPGKTHVQVYMALQ